MNDRTLRVLEYHKILAMLADRASSSLGKELALGLRPIDDPVMVREMLQETSECRQLRDQGEGVPLGGIHDIRTSVQLAGAGGVLGPEALVSVVSTLRAARQVGAFFVPRAARCPLLYDWAQGLGDFRTIERSIDGAIGPGGEVLDSASPALARVRAQKRTMQNRLKDRLDSMVRSADIVKYLQEPIVTLRNDRYVVPVRQEFKAMVPGIVHDQSASGATLFVEPVAVVELNNNLRQLESQEEEEIRRVLAELSRRVGDRAPEIRASVEILAHLDFVTARARLGEDQGAIEPVIEDGGVVTLVGARHPLLSGTVVPIDLELGRRFDTLVITGPNTGGKTVTLKTVGLLTLMAQSGLHVPARHGTGLSVFERVFSDIGDEQSIEQSLSTFSSHMTHIVDILSEARGSDTLVLLDELGAGTDPTEGAALAMSVLEHLHARGVRTVATTHYAELKTFAYTTPGLENASVEFDVQTLRPTYRLMLGTPGRSNAFEISLRLGLPGLLVDRARGMLSDEERTVEELIENIQGDERAARQNRLEADRLRLKYEGLLREMDDQRRRFENEKSQLLTKAREEARNVVERVRRETDDLIKVLRSEAEQNRLEEAARFTRNEIRQQREELDRELETPKRRPAAPPKNLKPGEPVHSASLNRDGSVIEVDTAAGQAVVQFGIMKVTLELADLERSEPKGVNTRKPSGSSAVAAGKASSIPIELDLRGMTADEAIMTVDKYLDDAILAGLPMARIIHGKGTGALRTAVVAYLSQHPHIQSHRPGESGEGGSGVTVVQIV